MRFSLFVRKSPPHAKRILAQSQSVLFRFLLPFLLVGVVYDSLRYVDPTIRGEIHIKAPYVFDQTYFGITTQNGVLTPNEWWQLHTSPILDFITGFFYMAFIAIFVVMTAYFVFYRSRTGNQKLSREELGKRAPRMAWSFFFVNAIGYATYYLYPAAPPWYASEYGFGPANLLTPSDPAGCARFDAMIGYPYFADFYAKSSNIFGAVPSLHVSYPLIAVYFAFQFAELRILALIYYFMMCFSAVYLNHHYILDILWGSAYALLIPFLLEHGVDAYQHTRFAKALKKGKLLQQFTRSQMASIVATVLDFFVTFAVTEWLGAWYMVGSGLGAFTGALTHFTVSRYWSFEAHDGKVSKQAPRYLLIAGASLLINSCLVYFLTEFSGLPYLWSKAVAGLVVGWGFNFPLHRRYVFARY